MAVDAGNRMLHPLDGIFIRYLVDPLEALGDVAVSLFLVRDVNGGVAVQARARLGGNYLAPSINLVLQHVGMAALLAEIGGERVTLPHGPETGILFDF